MSRTLLLRKKNESPHSVAEGLRNSEIAKFVGTTTNMVTRNYLRTIFDKTGTLDPFGIWRCGI